jgi:hypothetical protein
VPLDDLHAFVAERLSNSADAFARSTQDQEHRSRGGRLYAQALPNCDLAEHADLASDGDDFEFATRPFGDVLHEDLADPFSLSGARAESTGLLVNVRQQRQRSGDTNMGISCKHADPKFGRGAGVPVSRF